MRSCNPSTTFNEWRKEPNRFQQTILTVAETQTEDLFAKRLKLMEQQLMVYRVIVEDKERIRSTNELLNNFQSLFLEWCGVNKSLPKPDEIKNGLLYFIPSYYLTNTVEFHQTYMNFEHNLTNNIPPSYVVATHQVPQLHPAGRASSLKAALFEQAP